MGRKLVESSVVLHFVDMRKQKFFQDYICADTVKNITVVDVATNEG